MDDQTWLCKDGQTKAVGKERWCAKKVAGERAIVGRASRRLETAEEGGCLGK